MYKQIICLLMFVFSLHSSHAQSLWWQREVPQPSENQIINQDYISKKRELEIAFDLLQNNIKAEAHFRSLGQNTQALRSGIIESKSIVNKLENELSKIPMYITNIKHETKTETIILTRENESSKNTHVNSKESVSYTPIETQKSIPNKINEASDLTKYIYEIGLSIDSIEGNKLTVKDKNNLIFNITYGKEIKNLSFSKNILLKNNINNNEVFDMLEKLNTENMEFKFYMKSKKNSSQRTMVIEKNYPFVIKNEYDEKIKDELIRFIIAGNYKELSEVYRNLKKYDIKNILIY